MNCRFEVCIRQMLFFLAAAFLLSGCAAKEAPPSAESVFGGRSIRQIALFPVTVEKNQGFFSVPYGVDIEKEFRLKLAEVLRAKGYEVTMVPEGDSASDADAMMSVHIKELFYDVYDSRSIHSISIFAVAELKSPSAESLWQDEAIAWVEGIGYEFPERLRLLTILSERLFDTLPDAERRASGN